MSRLWLVGDARFSKVAVFRGRYDVAAAGQYHLPRQLAKPEYPRGRNPRADFTGADGEDRPHVTVPIMLGTVVTLTESIDFRYEVYA